MIHLFINALAASAGGGLTYVRNVIPHLASRRDVRVTIALDARLRHELQTSPNISFVEAENSNTAARFWYEQRAVRASIKESRADVLLSAGTFSLWTSKGSSP